MKSNRADIRGAAGVINMDLLKEIGNGRRIAIAGHVRPDGDAISSCLAVRNYLYNAIPDAGITVYLSNMPTIFSYMKGYDEIDGTYAETEPYDVFIALDCSDRTRLDRALPIFDSAKKKICVDHHESNVGYADVTELKAEASSTCEVLFDIFDRKYIDDEVAMDLYTGIVHDSGVFQYSNMSRHSFEIVGELTEYNFDGPEIIQKTFYEKTYAQNQILGRALLESVQFMDKKCIFSVIDKKTMDFYQVQPKHFEGIVNQLQHTRGTEVAIFMYELELQKYKVSMRSNGKVNVAQIAVVFGGGGHDRAAGIEMNGTVYDIINALSEKIEEQLKNLESDN